MVSRIKYLAEYESKFTKSFTLLKKIVTSISRSLLVVNANTVYLCHCIKNWLDADNVVYHWLSSNDIRPYNDIGYFLRERNQNLEEILVIDLVDTLNFLCNDEKELAIEINVNRDLFTKKFRSVVFICPPSCVYAIANTAHDFWSCVEYYIDFTGWLVNPFPVPVVRINISANMPRILLQKHLEDNDDSDYNAYLAIREKVNCLLRYEPDKFLAVYNEINKLKHNIYYYDLFTFLAYKVISSKTASRYRNNKIEMLLSMEIDDKHPLTLLTTIDNLAAYFVRAGRYEKAIRYYKMMRNILLENWEDTKKNFILAFVACNILVCEYFQENLNTPESLLLRLKSRLQEFMLVKDKDCEFAKNYLHTIRGFLAKTYAQSNDAYTKLNDSIIREIQMLDISETIQNNLAWLLFNLHDFNLTSSASELESRISKLSYSIFKMLNCFKNGDYSKAKANYDSAKYMAESCDYWELSDILQVIKKNMFFIQKCAGSPTVYMYAKN